jgi:SRSO17 transposase
MTDEEIRELGPAFAAEVSRYRGCFGRSDTAGHFGTFCRGLLTDLPRKSVEPIALAAGETVRTLQVFLAGGAWDEEAVRETVQRRLAGVLASRPADDLGVVGVIDETSCEKKGDRTPGVQRQYLGCTGKLENGIVTVHVGVAAGRFRALVDADLYLPKAWADDRDRCRDAGIPDDVTYRPKWRMAFDQYVRLRERGHRFDWLVFDEGYGSKPAFLWLLSFVGQKFVAEVPVSFAVRRTADGPAVRADDRLPRARALSGRRFHLTRETTHQQVWRAEATPVRVNGRRHTLVVGVCEATGEVKYFLTNATTASLRRIIRVAFRRWTVEHLFRVAKSEVGLMHYEGRTYRGLVRHLILCLVVLSFVAIHTDRLRGKKPGRVDGAGLPGVEPAVSGPAPPPTSGRRRGPHRQRDPLPAAA